MDGNGFEATELAEAAELAGVTEVEETADAAEVEDAELADTDAADTDAAGAAKLAEVFGIVFSAAGLGAAGLAVAAASEIEVGMLMGVVVVVGVRSVLMVFWLSGNLQKFKNAIFWGA